MQSPAMYPPRKYPNPNKDINRLITQKDPSLPPIIEKYPNGYKQLFNDTHDPSYTEYNPNDSTDNWLNENEDYVNKLKVDNNKNNNYE